MIIHTYTKVILIVNDIYSLSVLMEEIGEKRRHVFLAIYGTLQHENGTFFVGYENNQKVSYGLLTHGTEDPLFKRLKYFAVEKSARNKKFGLSTLKSVIAKEVNLNAGIGLTCNVSLQKFYESLGFKYVSRVDEPLLYGENEVILNLNAPSTDTKRKDYGSFHELTINENQDIFNFYRQIERMYNINLDIS